MPYLSVLRAKAVAVVSILLCAWTCACAEPIATPIQISTQFHTGDRYMHVRLLGTVRLVNTPLHGFAASELSGIAWDEDEQVLYAVSDAGHLVHLRPQFDGDILSGTELVATYPLLNENGTWLGKHLRDAEGLAIRKSANSTSGDSELLISFEGKPRVSVYRPTGNYVGEEPLPKALRRKEDYAGTNSQLEAVTLHPVVGMILAPQRRLKSSPKAIQGLYDAAGRVWTFPSLERHNCAIVGLETTPAGDVLVLERRYKNVFSPVVFAVRRVHLDPARQPDGGAVIAEDVMRMDNTEGWMVDNFEGIARHRESHYFLVSDDNNSALQSTLLMYFEIIE